MLGPPASGKSTRCEALAAQLGLTHASLPALLHDCASSESPPSSSCVEPDALREALRRGEALPPGGVLELLRRAVVAAESGLLLLEVPAQAGLLPSLLLLLPPPLLLLLLDAPDEVCMRRLDRRATAAGQPPLPRLPLAQVLSAHRTIDEPVARAFGAALPGRLCVVGPHLGQVELPSLLCAALHNAARARMWRGVASPTAVPLLLASGGESGAGAYAVAAAMADRWGLSVLTAASLLEQRRQQQATTVGGNQRTVDVRRVLHDALRARAAAGWRCILVAEPPQLQAALLALVDFAAERASLAVAADSPRAILELAKLPLGMRVVSASGGSAGGSGAGTVLEQGGRAAVAPACLAFLLGPRAAVDPAVPATPAEPATPAAGTAAATATATAIPAGNPALPAAVSAAAAAPPSLEEQRGTLRAACVAWCLLPISSP